MINVIDMYSNVKSDFPDIFTKRGELIKREPKKYQCDCGHSHSTLKTTGFIMGMGFASSQCPKCGKRGKDNVSYNIWKRMINNQIREEDFILNIVLKEKTITKERLQTLLHEKFGKVSHALGTLVYFGYLHVDSEKRDNLGVVEYSINAKKNLNQRLELIR